jgi:uncharacterized protein YegL
MRRLPIFFVLDVSESMVGEPLKRMEEGIGKIVASLRQDPHSLETVYICLIAFAGKAKSLTPLIDLVSFYPPKMPVGGGTALGSALDVLMNEIDSQVLKTSYETRGDWEPVVFLITDGKPTDNPSASVKRWQQEYAAHASMVAITLGTNADMQVLGQLTETVLALEHSSDEDFRKFIEWVSASVRAQSQKVDIEGTPGGISLEKVGDAGLTLIKDTEHFTTSDPDYVILTGKCSNNKQPYLIKYARVSNAGMELFVKSDGFHLEGAFALDDSYFDWSSEQPHQEAVNASTLQGVPPCPNCGNSSAFAMCECGHLMCIDQTGLVMCPWCDRQLQFNMGQGDSQFNVNRGQG